MNLSVKVTGVQSVAARFRNIEQQLGRSMESILNQEARALCVSASFYTNPTGATGERRLKRKVMGDIRKVYLDRDAIFTITAMMKPRSMKLAMGFMRSSKAGNLAQANRYLKQAGMKIEALSPASLKIGHKAARTGPYGGVPEELAERTIVRKPTLYKYIREKQATVGTAKAGWYAAAKSLGGRVRRNLKDAAGNRSTIETIPAWVRKVANRTAGLGGSRQAPGRVEVFTNVAHAADALSVEDLDIVIENAQASFMKAITKSLIATLRKPGVRRAA